MSRFLGKKYRDLDVYIPGEQPQDMEYIKLNTNESPYPPAKTVIDAVNVDEVSKLRLYSDPECLQLRTKLAQMYGIEPYNIFFSNGSDDILNFAFMAFCGDKTEVVFPAVSYGFYKVFARFNYINYTEISLKVDFSINYRDYCGVNKTVVIANPNAPTGICLPVAEIEEIVKSNPDNIVVIDEAYIDFGGESVYPLIKKYDNLLVVQTFSKSRSLAGGRLGFAIASKAVIEDLNKMKYSTNPYNVNRLTLAAGLATLNANDYYMENCKKIMQIREYTVCKLVKLNFTVLPSQANFIFACSNDIDGGKLYIELKKRGVLVRHFDDKCICKYVRITIGTKQQMDILIAKVKEILEVDVK